MLEGCWFNLVGFFNVGKDVWFVGYCIVLLIIVYDKLMVFVGFVVMCDMEINYVYGGLFVVDLIVKVGVFFDFVDLDIKFL